MTKDLFPNTIGLKPEDEIDEDAVCHCNAYPWPHQPGLGRCHVEDLDKPICASCGEHSESKVIDDGIGHYEYWGATGFHHDWTTVSACCEDNFISPRTGKECAAPPLPEPDFPEPDYD